MDDSRYEVDMRSLIQMVQNRPCLWNRNYSEYRDKSSREQAWLEICSSLDSGFEERDGVVRDQYCSQIMKKWYNIRDSYVKSLKQSLRSPKGRRSKRYIYSECLSFLRPLLSIHPSSSQSVEEKSTNDEEETADRWLDETYVNINENEPPMKQPKLEFTQSEVVEGDENCSENIINILAKLIQREEDEDRSFFKSITPSVKALSNDSKFKFRIKVMQLLRDLQAKERKKSFKLDNKLNFDSE